MDRSCSTTRPRSTGHSSVCPSPRHRGRSSGSPRGSERLDDLDEAVEEDRHLRVLVVAQSPAPAPGIWAALPRGRSRCRSAAAATGADRLDSRPRHRVTVADRPDRSPGRGRRTRTRGPAAAVRGGQTAPAPRPRGRTRPGPATASAPAPVAEADQVLGGEVVGAVDDPQVLRVRPRPDRFARFAALQGICASPPLRGGLSRTAAAWRTDSENVVI